ncbi:Serine/threonine-protein phosphatase BSL1-like [Glycine soja]|uniref:Serine/threonine-protein phosphatase n=1 Tax=Glycine soja TaxID=3848 RepID=A0A445LQ95_GLYSO|nr:Serine/threonine-protein phosphatase BSL1-like [Glycine soja]
MGSKPWLYPAPTYRTIETFWVTDEDAPGPRCGHTLTAVAATKTQGPRLILFGGATAIEGGSSSAPGIRLAGVTNTVHSYDVQSRKWTSIKPAGEPPSPRAAHAAAAVGTMVVFQGGIGPAGHSTDDLYVLDLTNDKYKWHRVVVQGQGPGPRYGHVMDLVAQRYLVTVSGNDGEKNSLPGKRVVSDAWAFDTAQKPYVWQKLNPEGDRPSARMYATASARSDGMFLLCGGRDSSGAAYPVKYNSIYHIYLLQPLADAYGLLMHRNGQWEWTLAPGVSPSPRYQHAASGQSRAIALLQKCYGASWLWGALGTLLRYNLLPYLKCRESQGLTCCESSSWLLLRPLQPLLHQRLNVFVGARLHVTGGVLRGGRSVEGEASIAVLDTAAGVWLDRNGIVSSSRSNKGHDYDPSLELMRRCRHAAAAVGVHIFIYGGLRGDILLDDFLVAENSPLQPDINSPERASPVTSSKQNQSNLNYNVTTPNLDGGPDIPSSGGSGMDKNSLEKLREASAAEAEAASAVWQAVQAISSNPAEETSVSDDNSQAVETVSDGSDTEGDVRLHPRAVVVAKEALGNLGGMIISTLLRPRNWKAPANRRFFLDSYEVGELCYAAEQIFMHEPTVLQLKAPVKVFGDLHGQFGDLMRLFDEYGFPSTAGDITYIDYLFLGDYVDRGQHSLETITLLLALKAGLFNFTLFNYLIEYPENVHLIRGNHEAADINALFGFRIECIERMGENDGIWAWTRFNQLFNYLPLASLIEKKIICMHGGIGRSINSVEQIEKLERPITMDTGSITLMDLLWSDPTENDSVEGLRPNARGPGLVTFGPDRVTEFCKKNKLQLIIRAHECVMDGFERFAQGQLITLFSATNYCGTANNAGAILVVGRGLVVVPKLIHPIPPPLQSPETSPERVMDETWMQELNIQRPPTPTRGRPQPDLDRGSLAYI